MKLLRWDRKLLLLALLVPAFFAQSYLHARAVVAAERNGCVRLSERLALDANNLRGDVTFLAAQVRGSRMLAASSMIPAPARQERRQEAAAATLAIGRKLREIRTSDSQVDAGQWRFLVNAEDRRRVRRSRFSCAGAYPEPAVVGGA